MRGRQEKGRREEGKVELEGKGGKNENYRRVKGEQTMKKINEKKDREKEENEKEGD